MLKAYNTLLECHIDAVLIGELHENFIEMCPMMSKVAPELVILVDG